MKYKRINTLLSAINSDYLFTPHDAKIKERNRAIGVTGFAFLTTIATATVSHFLDLSIIFPVISGLITTFELLRSFKINKDARELSTNIGKAISERAESGSKKVPIPKKIKGKIH